MELKTASGGKLSIKVVEDGMGLLVTVRGSNSVQKFRIMNCTRKRAVKQFLRNQFANS
jgi:hypothetical protein